MITKYDVDDILYVPFVVTRIVAEGSAFNGEGTTVKYQLQGKNVLNGSFITINEHNTDIPGFTIHTARDFK